MVLWERTRACMCACVRERVLDKEGSRVFASIAPAVAERSCILPVIVIIRLVSAKQFCHLKDVSPV